MKSRKIAFDVRAAIPAAWDKMWAENLKRRREDVAYEKKHGRRPFDAARTYFLTAASIEREVREMADRAATATGMSWGVVRISGNLQRAVRDWLLRGPRGLQQHNFGRGHISGMRFRPRGEPLAPAEKATNAAHEKRAADRKAGKESRRHFSMRGYGSHPQCVVEQRRKKGHGHGLWRQSKARVTRDATEVTCPSCLKWIAANRVAIERAERTRTIAQLAEAYDPEKIYAGDVRHIVAEVLRENPEWTDVEIARCAAQRVLQP